MARTAHDLSEEEVEAPPGGPAPRAGVAGSRRAHGTRPGPGPEATALLREKFGATRVVVFGSLVREGCFTPWSDVDVGAWGLRPEDTFRVIGTVQLDSEIEVNLVDVNASVRGRSCHA